MSKVRIAASVMALALAVSVGGCANMFRPLTSEENAAFDKRHPDLVRKKSVARVDDKSPRVRQPRVTPISNPAPAAAPVHAAKPAVAQPAPVAKKKRWWQRPWIRFKREKRE